MPAAARIGDPVDCGDTIDEGSGNVFANGIPMSRNIVDHTAGHCFSPTLLVSDRTISVFINNYPSATVTDRINPHTCSTNTHGGSVSIGSPNVFVDDGTFVPPATVPVYILLDPYKQPNVTRAVAGVTHDDDPDSDYDYVLYRQTALADAGFTIPSSGEVDAMITETAPAPNPAPATLPHDCSDITAFVGTFPGSFLLSPNFTLAQVTTNTLVSKYTLQGQVGLTDKDIVCNLRALCVNVLEPLLASYGTSLKINSGFRRGTGSSQHYKGQAVDVSFTGIGGADAMYGRAVEIQNTIQYDQFIYEQNNSIWYHISFDSALNRRIVMTKAQDEGYRSGLHKIG